MAKKLPQNCFIFLFVHGTGNSLTAFTFPGSGFTLAELTKWYVLNMPFLFLKRFILSVVIVVLFDVVGHKVSDIL